MAKSKNKKMEDKVKDTKQEEVENQKEQAEEVNAETQNEEVNDDEPQATNEETPEEESKEETEAKEEEPKGEINIDYKDKYIRLAAEFDNYKRRTARERMDLIKTANQDILVALLPVIDDLDRAKKSVEEATDIEAVKGGLDLIFNKFNEFLVQKGLKEVDALHQDFDTDLHEALTKIPAPEEKLKGKVVDVIQKGYTLNEKVVRFAKVVIGE